MKAAYLEKHGGVEVIQVGELPTPEPGVREVRVRVRAAALNHLDLWVRKGLAHLKLDYPHILGGDAAGVVEAVGNKVGRFKAGDEVIVHPGLSCGECGRCASGWESLCPKYQILGEHVRGTHAEFVVVPEQNVFAKPSQISMEAAASVPLVFTTAWQMMHRRAQLKSGEWILIHAAGSGVSSAGIQIAAKHGARVIATSRSEAKLEKARELGAHYVIDSRAGDWVDSVRKIVGKGGVEVIFDHVGQAHWESHFKLLGWGGRLVTCGATTGFSVKLDLRQVFYRQIQILGSTMGDKADFPQVLEGLASGAFRAVVDRAFPLDQAAQAHTYLESGQPFGKVLLSP